MEISVSSIVGAIVVVTLVRWALQMVNWVWWRPKKLERYLRNQGLKGNSYKLLYGDSKESSSMTKEAHSRPITLSDDIVPRVIPFENHIFHKYGKASFTWFGPSPRVMIMEPEQIKDVFVNFRDFQKPKSKQLRKKPSSALVELEGEEWATRRKIINPAFHAEKLKLMFPAFYLCCDEMIQKWQNLAADEGSVELDVCPYLKILTEDAISRTAFGSSYEEGRVIFKLLKEITLLFMKVIQSPSIPLLRYLPTKMKKRMKEINSTIESVLKGIINKKENAMENGEASTDLLGILLESRNIGMSTADVIEECQSFYFAGQDTTSVLLTWTVVLLCQHPVWQDRAREEVLQMFGDDKPDYEGLNRLEIVTMILNEVLRLYPPAAMLTRYLHNETTLGNLTLPAGAYVALPILLVHHDKTIWGEDANEFKPERFAQGISKAARNTSSFFPFGWGPRMCIGQKFAMVEAKLALAMMLRSFWFELSPSYLHAPIPAAAIRPQHGCHIILHKR